MLPPNNNFGVTLFCALVQLWVFRRKLKSWQNRWFSWVGLSRWKIFKVLIPAETPLGCYSHMCPSSVLTVPTKCEVRTKSMIFVEFVGMVKNFKVHTLPTTWNRFLHFSFDGSHSYSVLAGRFIIGQQHWIWFYSWDFVWLVQNVSWWNLVLVENPCRNHPCKDHS